MVHTPLEVKLAEERNLLRMVIDNLPDVIYAKDSGARKILANQADLKLMGCKTEAEVVGKTDFEFYPKDIAAKLIQDDHLVLWQGQSIIGREEKIIKHDGEICWLLTTKVPWRDVTGRVIGLVGIGRDITDRKRLEEQSQQTRRMENIGQRTSGIANDLKDVLTPILDSIVSLRQKIKDKEGVKLLDSVEADAKRGVDVVKRVVWFGRELEGRCDPVDVNQLLESVVHTVSETFSRSIEVGTDIATDVRSVPGNQAQLYQALLNLSVNARDAMPNGGKLKLGARNFTADDKFAGSNPGAERGEYVLIEVTDTGHGIPPKIRDQIFAPFFTTRESGKGRGMGLATALSIVKGHGGFILVESQPGKGSTFQVYLPLGRP